MHLKPLPTKSSDALPDGPWADADALHDGTDYGQLAKLWKRQGHLTAEPQSAQRTTTEGSLVTTTAGLPLPKSQPLPPSFTSSANLRALCVKTLRRLEEKALTLLHWGLISEKRCERRLARQIMRQWLRVDESGEVVWWKKLPKRQRSGKRKRPSRKAQRRWTRHAAARRRVEKFLADLGAPLVLRPIPARMRRTTTAHSPQMNADKHRCKRQKQQTAAVVVTKTTGPGRYCYPRSSAFICGLMSFWLFIGGCVRG